MEFSDDPSSLHRNSKTIPESPKSSGNGSVEEFYRQWRSTPFSWKNQMPSVFSSTSTIKLCFAPPAPDLIERLKVLLARHVVVLPATKGEIR